MVNAAQVVTYVRKTNENRMVLPASFVLIAKLRLGSFLGVDGRSVPRRPAAKIVTTRSAGSASPLVSRDAPRTDRHETSGQPPLNTFK